MRNPGNTRHGHHGTPTYEVWKGMRQRCSNPNQPAYPDYGGRGIAVCDRWQSFDNFLADMGKRPVGMSIERQNNNGNYEPGNCVWASRTVQNRNSRHNVVTADIVAQIREIRHFVSLREIAAKFGISKSQAFNIANDRQWVGA